MSGLENTGMEDLPRVVTNPSTDRARRSLNFVDVISATPNQPLNVGGGGVYVIVLITYTICNYV